MSHPQDINDPSKLQAWNNFSEVALVLDLVLSLEPLALVGFHVVLSLHSGRAEDGSEVHPKCPARRFGVRVFL